MKKFIQYSVKAVDEKSVLNKFCYGLITWFEDGRAIAKESENFTEDEKAWEWIEKELGEIEKENNK